MRLFKSKNIAYLPALLSGFAIFIFSAFALVVPSGYSYGPALLLLCCFSLFITRKEFQIEKQDWVFINILLMYFIIHALLNIFFSLPIRVYDGLMRFLLVIPVYILLIKFPPKPIFFWSGLVIGGIGAGAFAIYQKFFNTVSLERANGHINAIQFGDISFLMGGLLLCGVVWAIYSLKNYYLAAFFFVASIFGFLASFLSLSRGGWLAIPFVVYVIYKALNLRVRRLFLTIVLLSCVLMLSVLIALPSSNAIKQRFSQTQVDMFELFKGDSGSETTSFSTRMQMWDVGVDAFKARPIAGWGDITAIKKQFPEQWKILNSIDDFNHLHNEYLDELAKRGIIGFMALMALYLMPLSYFLRLMRRRDRQTIAFAASGVILILCVMVFGLTQTFMAHISGVTIFSFYVVIIKAYCRNLEKERFALKS